MTNLKQVDTSKPLNHAAHEEEVLSYWDQVKAFERSVSEKSGDKSYVFYDGPPFATGLPHYGHLLASTAKDVVPRYWTMKGYRVERTWGWDCHGVPIENMIEGELGLKGGKKGIEDYGIANFNAACRTSILRYDAEWKKIIRRLGRWVDMENSYKTMDLNFMESVWWAFAELYKKGLVYEGRKVILYCPRCSTPLSNFEIAMDNSYKDVEAHSLTVKFKKRGSENEYFVAWTTTPWTLPGNVALAVNPEAEYVQLLDKGELLWYAKTRAPKDLTIKQTVKGKSLIGERYTPLYSYLPIPAAQKAYEIIGADFVSLDDGTGIVHTAAIYGEDDYRVSIKEGLPTIPMLDEAGHFLDFVTDLKGQYYLKAQSWIIKDLTRRNLVYKSEMAPHSAPFCYRCGTALFYNALPAYFINIQKLKPGLIKANESISWYPGFLKHGRFGKGLESAPDWNISRSRYWGTPMPVWRGDKTGKLRVIGSIAELKQWAVDPSAINNLTDIHRESVDDLKVWVDDEKTEAGTRIKDVFDCWVESGSMPFASVHYPFENKAKFDERYPAQYIVEYIAQTRAWFYTLHVMSVGLFGKHAYENAVTTGTILAEDGTKMSKSKKNYPDVNVLINKYGVDSLRLYLMSSVVMKADNLNFSERSVDDIRKNVMNIWWNIYVFSQSLPSANSTSSLPAPSSLHILDQWLLSSLSTLIAEVTESMDHYDVTSASRKLMSFAKDFSTWYLRLSRTRLKTSATSRYVLAYSLRTYSLLMAPFTPFMAERIYHGLKGRLDSVHLELYPTPLADFQNPGLQKEMQTVMSLVELAHALRKQAGIRLRQPLPSLTISADLSAELRQLLADELNVKAVHIGSTLSLDTRLTPALRDEGEARDLMRQIQGERKKLGLTAQAKVAVTLPSYPDSWAAEIKNKVGAASLTRGSEFRVTPL